MKRFLAVCIVVVLLVLGVVAALPRPQVQAQAALIATIYPLALMLQDLAPPQRQVHCIVAPGVSPHVFSPKPSDAQRCTEALILLSVSSDFDAWAAQLPVQHHIELLALLDHKQLLAAAVHADHDHGSVDPHVWMDPLLMSAAIQRLAALLAEADPEYAAHYRERGVSVAAAYRQQAAELRSRSEALRGKSVVQFHQSLAYLLRFMEMGDAGVVTPQVGSNPGPRYLEELIQQAREQGVIAICTEPQLPRRAAEHIARQMQLPLCLVDPLGFDVHSLSALWNKNVDALLELKP